MHCRDDLQFTYHYSSIDELVILRASFALEREDRTELTKRMQTLWIVRKSKQPSSDENRAASLRIRWACGPASLIEQAGLKGAKSGGAEISDVNANFVIARTGTTSDNVLRLIEMVSRQVSERIGVELETDIEIW